jgi:hypothetical protein
MSLGFTSTIGVEFSDNTLTFSEPGRPPVTIPYRDHPEIFGHPRFLMISLDQSVALITNAIRELIGRRLIAPKFLVTIERRLEGGLTDMDKKIIEQILMEAGGRKVEFKNDSVPVRQN